MQILKCENMLGTLYHVKLSDKKMTSGWNDPERAIYEYEFRKREGLKISEFDIPQFYEQNP